MRKHFKNWSILATIIGGTIIGTPNAKADMDVMNMVDTISRQARPVIQLKTLSDQAAIAERVVGGTSTQQDLAKLDPNSPFGKVATTQMKYNELVKEKGKTSTSAAMGTDEELGESTSAVAKFIDPEVWQKGKAFRATRTGLNVLISPILGTQYLLNQLSAGRAKLHQLVDEAESPSKTAKAAVVALDVLALPFTALEYGINKLVSAIYACHEYLLNPNIKPLAKVLGIFKLGLLVLTAKAAVTAVWALAAGIAI